MLLLVVVLLLLLLLVLLLLPAAAAGAGAGAAGVTIRRLFVQTPSADVQQGFMRWCNVMKSLEAGLDRQGAKWSRHNMLGYITCCPS